ncbi:carboxylesterase [Desulfatiferula olefinivorans]
MTVPDIPPACLDRLIRERTLFEDECRRHFRAGETKGPQIGSPIFLHHPGSSDAVLLIHGLMAAPFEVGLWAEDLFAKGYTVYAPRLAGHGTSADDLAGRNFADWVDSVERGYEILSLVARRIVAAGFSTGAGLALHQAVIHPGRYRAVISASAPMRFAGPAAGFSEAVEVWNRLAARLNLSGLRKPFARNHPDHPEINYSRCPIHAFNQVKALMRQVRRGLPGLTVPALIIQGSRDPKVHPRSGRMIADRIDSSLVSFEIIDHDRHGIVRGEAGHSFFETVHAFLDRLDA